jgi:hypothetical protein
VTAMISGRRGESLILPIYNVTRHLGIPHDGVETGLILSLADSLNDN